MTMTPEQAFESATKEVAILRSLAAAMYQVAGAYDILVSVLDVLAAAGNDEPISQEQVDALLPCDTPGGTAVFTRREVREAYATLRTYNRTIPDECLDAMRDALLAMAQPD